MPRVVDLRSDTVTRPTPAMRAAMLDAAVGDDVYGEDPSVNELQAQVAARLGKEAGLFVSSGTMGNQLAIAIATRPGDEVIVSEGAHVAFYEVGAAAALSGVQFQVAGDGASFDEQALLAACKPRAYYSPRSALVCFENTHNRQGGVVTPLPAFTRTAAKAKSLGLQVHLDGARLWNAAIASGHSLAELAGPADTVSVCFSKGLGAPVGSVLCGSAEAIERARRLRKMWGGGMRQAGLLAAACQHALEHHLALLADDHRRAALLADAVNGRHGLRTNTPSTNIVLLQLPEEREAGPFVAALRDRGVLASEWSPRSVRLVTHLDVDDDGLAQAIASVLAVGAAC